MVRAQHTINFVIIHDNLKRYIKIKNKKLSANFKLSFVRIHCKICSNTIANL